MTSTVEAGRVHGRHRDGARTVRRVAGLTALVVMVVVLCAASYWRVSGGRWFVVQTPSMGQAAPVGTLLLTRDTTVARTRVGDLITFHSPSGETYTHRVVAKTATGLHTRGDINAIVDPWTITDRELVGAVVARWWAVGWALRGLPLVLLGLALTWTVAMFVRPRRRSAVRQLGTTLTISAVTWWLHPWVGLQKLGVTSLASATTNQGGDPAAALRVVSTGILPIRVQNPATEVGANLRNGQVANVALSHHAASGGYRLDAALHLSTGWWIAVIAFCLAPLVWSLATAPRRVDVQPGSRAGSDQSASETVPA